MKNTGPRGMARKQCHQGRVRGQKDCKVTNPKKKISVIFGPRPEAIKLLPLVLEAGSAPRFDCRVCVTAQHRELLDDALEGFGISADRDLDLMEPGQSLGDLTARAVAALDKYLAKQRPDLVLVQGDTTTSFCAALAAFSRESFSS